MRYTHLHSIPKLGLKIPPPSDDDYLRAERWSEDRVIEKDWLGKLFAPRCPRCGEKMLYLSVEVEFDRFAMISEITQWHGDFCVGCELLDSGEPDVN